VSVVKNGLPVPAAKMVDSSPITPPSLNRESSG